VKNRKVKEKNDGKGEQVKDRGPGMKTVERAWGDLSQEKKEKAGGPTTPVPKST